MCEVSVNWPYDRIVLPKMVKEFHFPQSDSSFDAPLRNRDIRVQQPTNIEFPDSKEPLVTARRPVRLGSKHFSVSVQAIHENHMVPVRFINPRLGWRNGIMQDSDSQLFDGWKWDLTYKGKTLMTLFIRPTREGMLLGFSGNELGDIHLTVYFKDGRIFSHVTDQHRPLRPWNLNFDEKLLSRKAEKAFRKWMKTYSPNKHAWIMTPYLKRKLASQFPHQDGRIKMPVEMLAAELVFDRDNSKRWRKVKIRELLTRADGPGLTVIDGKLQWVQPLDSKRMLAFTDRQFERYWRMVFRELGLDKYLEYVAAAYPELLANVRRKLKKMS